MSNPKKPIISLSFKEDEKWLYDILMKYSSPTGTIKDILKVNFGDSHKQINIENTLNFM